MDQVEINKKKFLIEEYGEEYKSLLNKYISEYRQDPTYIVDIADLSSIDRHAKSIFRITDRTRKMNKIFNLIGLLGAVYAVIGFILSLVSLLVGFSEWQISDYAESIVLIVSTVFCVVGTSCNLISIFLKTREYQKYKPNRRFDTYYETSTNSSEFQIIMIWKEIEMLLFKLAPEDIQTDLKSILKFLSDVNAIDKKDVININRIRECRNMIVHSNILVKYDDMQKAINDGHNIIAKLYLKL